MLIITLFALAAQQWPTQLVTHAYPANANQTGAYGSAVKVDGDTAVVAAAGGVGLPGGGEAFVFVRENDGWSNSQVIPAPDPGTNQAFGASVDLEGDLLAIGDSAWGNGGRAWFYRRVGGAFVLEGDTGLFLPQASYLGSAVAVDEDNDRIAVAAGGYDPGGGTWIGGIWLFEPATTGPGWDEVATLVPSSLVSTTSFADEMVLEGDLLLAGHSRYGALSSSGGVFVFERSNGSWGETGVLEPPQPQANDQFGSGLALDGTTLLVGLPGRNGFTGVVHSYRRAPDGSFLFEQEFAAANPKPGMNLGRDLAIDGNAALVGAPYADAGEKLDAGAVLIFSRQADNWADVGRLRDPYPGTGDNLGYVVSLSGKTAVLGNPSNGWVAPLAGSAVFYDLLPNGLSYCTAGTSAAGCSALLTSAGQPSASAPTGFALIAQGLEGQRDGLFFFGASGRQANPWGSGTSFQCVVPPVNRTGLLTGTGTAGLCDGVLTRDLNAWWCPSCPKPAANPGAGAVVQAQLWYRDPASSSNQTTGLSDALEFHVAP